MRRGGPDATFSRVFGRFFRSRRALDAVRRTRARTNRSSFRCGHCEVTHCRQDSQRPRADSVEARGGPRERRRAPRSAPRDRPRANRTPAAARAPAPPRIARAPPRGRLKKCRSPARPSRRSARCFVYFSRVTRALAAETDPIAPFRSVPKQLAERFSCRSRACWSWRRR
jgi:hypothetical protein